MPENFNLPLEPDGDIPEIWSDTLKNVLAANRAGGVDAPIEGYTCWHCAAWRGCEFAFDGYNTNGDCLAEK